MDNLRTRLDAIIIKLTNGLLTELELNETTDLVIDAYFDSITIIQCVVEIEQEFEIQFDDEQLLIDNIKNYRWLCDYVCKKVREKECHVSKEQ